MGGSSFKRIFLWRKKKKKSPLNKAWKHLRRALPSKKPKKKSLLPLDKVNRNNLRKKKPSQKRSSLTTDKKAPISLKTLSLGNVRKDSIQTAPPTEEKDGGGLGKIGEQIKKKFSKESTKVVPVSLKETKEDKEEISGKAETRVPKKKLNDILKSIRPTGSKANGKSGEKEA
ncbi:hypothetical protein EXN66_Car003624 [Channa argus]|uniref:Uncharacterized protein n=1 Tax=Channa argus TaxID=215402 RepID=A0A6G1PCI5_CHAAH|nr:hypothetical protein EXN66_Car003624 [Channa argus]KAK2918664.1 hypothetical protein Q8A73_003035 [Channa argus]